MDNNKRSREKLKAESEETIIRGMKMNIDNKGIGLTEKLNKLLKKNVFKNNLNMETKDKLFYNKHIVSDRLQSLVALNYSRSMQIEKEEPLERMFEFGDVKSKWERLEKGE